MAYDPGAGVDVSGGNAGVTNDPYINKSLAAALTWLVTVAAQWVATENFNLSGEGVTAIGGAVATFLVYVISNHKKLFGK